MASETPASSPPFRLRVPPFTRSILPDRRGGRKPAPHKPFANLYFRERTGAPPTGARPATPGSTWARQRRRRRDLERPVVLEDDFDGGFCYAFLHPLADGTVPPGYCALEELARSRIAKVPVAWLYDEAKRGSPT